MDVVFNAHRYFAVNSYIIVFVHNWEKDELKLIAEQIKLDGATPLVNQRKNFAISYIRRLSGIKPKMFFTTINIYHNGCIVLGRYAFVIHF